MVKQVQHMCDCLTNITINSGNCILISQLGFLGHLICKLGFFGDISTMDTSYDVFAYCLLGDGSTFDFCTFCPKNIGAPFLWFLLYWNLCNNFLRIFNIHTWTWTCLPWIRDFPNVVFASTSTWVHNVNWIEEASLFSIYCFNTFDSWAIAKLGSTKIQIWVYLFLGQWEHLGIL